MSIGVISPYKAQVHAIQQKIGNTYSTFSDFAVNVRSVDGFQGSEEDVIIISTVRCDAMQVDQWVFFPIAKGQMLR